MSTLLHGKVHPSPIPFVRLAIITAVTREKYLKRLEKSLETLKPYFIVQWCPYQDFEKKMTIGACWNMAIKQVKNVDTWLHFVDDDNEVHPEFGEKLLAEIIKWPQADVFLCRQYENGKKRFTWEPKMFRCCVDIGQIVVKLPVAQRCPFENTSEVPDGIWAEDIMRAGYAPIQTEIPTLYNVNQGK